MERVNALTVVLEKDTREDDVRGLVDAIRHLRGVVDVKGNVANPETWIAETRARNAMREKLLDLILGDK